MSIVYTYETVADMMLMDGNNHMRNSAYLDIATASRYRYLREAGFGRARLAAIGVGAVVRSDNAIYRKEVRHGEPLRIELRLSGASPKLSRYRFHNRILTGELLAATVETEGGWLHNEKRQLVFPPDELRDVMLGLAKTDDFETLRESVRL